MSSMVRSSSMWLQHRVAASVSVQAMAVSALLVAPGVQFRHQAGDHSCHLTPVQLPAAIQVKLVEHLLQLAVLSFQVVIQRAQETSHLVVASQLDLSARPVACMASQHEVIGIADSDEEASTPKPVFFNAATLFPSQLTRACWAGKRP